MKKWTQGGIKKNTFSSETHFGRDLPRKLRSVTFLKVDQIVRSSNETRSLASSVCLIKRSVPRLIVCTILSPNIYIETDSGGANLYKAKTATPNRCMQEERVHLHLTFSSSHGGGGG